MHVKDWIGTNFPFASCCSRSGWVQRRKMFQDSDWVDLPKMRIRISRMWRSRCYARIPPEACLRSCIVEQFSTWFQSPESWSISWAAWIQSNFHRTSFHVPICSWWVFGRNQKDCFWIRDAWKRMKIEIWRCLEDFCCQKFLLIWLWLFDGRFWKWWLEPSFLYSLYLRLKKVILKSIHFDYQKNSWNFVNIHFDDIFHGFDYCK